MVAPATTFVSCTIAPVFVGGLSAVGPLPRGRGPADAPASDGGPRLDRWTSTRLGEDLVLSGEIVWPPR